MTTRFNGPSFATPVRGSDDTLTTPIPCKAQDRKCKVSDSTPSVRRLSWTVFQQGPSLITGRHPGTRHVRFQNIYYYDSSEELDDIGVPQRFRNSARIAACKVYAVVFVDKSSSRERPQSFVNGADLHSARRLRCCGRAAATAQPPEPVRYGAHFYTALKSFPTATVQKSTIIYILFLFMRYQENEFIDSL
ncbi:hypothetical protein EVAR_6293_1 [Eumeta japonica]|uniref:Uncharacterized protein n=1 Tax=Eumeta variegata TaxID=151549 RepID=A0A4C1TBB6_EUMVA|nr:hypothetical protein EVAR_6293_1 [Eumeta japonica]